MMYNVFSDWLVGSVDTKQGFLHIFAFCFITFLFLLVLCMCMKCVFRFRYIHVGAIAKSARAAGLNASVADRYAVEASHAVPGNVFTAVSD